MVKNINKLKAKIVENGYSFKDFAKKIGFNETTLRRKINDPSFEFSITESLILKNELKLNKEEYIDIFLGSIEN